MITTLAIANYRSIRDLVIPLGQLNVITGANGTGKSNLYRALHLIAGTATGSAIRSIAREGGISSVLWAGPEMFSQQVRDGTYPVQGTNRKNVVYVRLGFQSDDYNYAIDYGLPPSSQVLTMFTHDAQIKREVIWPGNDSYHERRAVVDRRTNVIRVRNEEHKWELAMQNVPLNASVLSSLVNPNTYPDIFRVGQFIDGWRFYDQFRTDSLSPARVPQVGTFTPVVSNDGSDLPSAWQTICEIGDETLLLDSCEDAFPQSQVTIIDNAGLFELRFQQHGLLRSLSQAELSDGTLRYLFLLTALLTPRPPELMILNEPETSLHRELIPALARLIIKCAENVQIWVISHSQHLVDSLSESELCNRIELTKSLGESTIVDQEVFDRPSWRWPSR